MSPPRIQPMQIIHVALRVRDLEQSAAFYCALFGLEARPLVPPGEQVRVCAAPVIWGESSFGIILIQGLPGATQPVGMDHLSLEVSSAEDVEDIYAMALVHGAAATAPRVLGGFYQTYIFDPDGYKIEVATRELSGNFDVRILGGDATQARPNGAASASGSAPVREKRPARTTPGTTRTALATNSTLRIEDWGRKEIA